jgi:hypothetical protein
MHNFMKIGSHQFHLLNNMVEPLRNNNESGEQSEPSKIRRSKRMRKEKSFGPDFIKYLVEGSRNLSCKQEMISSNIESDQFTYEKGMM